MILPGSYANGFAPRDGQPLYPELWRGCVFAAAPCLGPTGLTLRDWSGFARHGTLTNGPNWQISDGSQSLGFDGVNDFVSVPNVANQFQSLTRWTISFWASASAYLGNTQAAIGLSNGTSTQSVIIYPFDALTGNGVRVYMNDLNVFGIIKNTTQALANNRRHHFCLISRSSTDIEMFTNGVSAGSYTAGATMGAGINTFTIGAWMTQYATVKIYDVRLYTRAIKLTEIGLLQHRPSVAYELAPRRRSRLFGGFQAYWAARKAQIIGGGL